MAFEKEKKGYNDPTLTGEDEFLLEDILAEYGNSRQQKILRDVEREAETVSSPVSEPTIRRRTAERMRPAAAEPVQPPVPEEPEISEAALPRPPRPVSLEDVVGNTVDAVMEEQELLRPKRGLFSRRKFEETEQLYARPEPEPKREEPEPIGPEPEMSTAAAQARDAWKARRQMLLPAFVVSLVPSVLAVAEQYGVVIPAWSGDIRFQSIVILSCLSLAAVLCRHVFVQAIRMLRKKRCTSELLISLSVLVALADCFACLFMEGRTVTAPYGAAACLALAFAQWGVAREQRALHDTFRTAAMDETPPYLVTDTERGACKQQGSIPGFYTAVTADTFSVLWQTALLPVVLMASVVFAGLSSLGQGRGGDFLLNWSIILAAGGTFGLPLCWTLPWAQLAKHLQKTGCAVGGWLGAERISRKKCMILLDADLFPPGTIRLNGVKVYGEEMRKVLTYAATMARASGSGLERMFDGLLRGENGQYAPLSGFSFFEEGGWAGTIRGESVLMGTASFMRKMDVRLPGDINLKTGVFLAVDRELIAVFAVKYDAAENVDFALRMMRRSHMMPLLASRDPNITPALLKRKFHKGVRMEYPNLTIRVALSEAGRDRDLPRALLLREGLMPYAETVVGSLRLCGAVRRMTLLSLAGSIIGTLLSFYLVFLGEYSLLTPPALVVFLLLWLLPVLLVSDWAGRY